MQGDVQFVGNFGPVGIIKQGLVQEAGLRRGPEGSFVQLHAIGQWAPSFNEAGNCRFIAGLAELGEQLAHAMYWVFHDEAFRMLFYLESLADGKFLSCCVETIKFAGYNRQKSKK
jgi:hypothetical protein